VSYSPGNDCRASSKVVLELTVLNRCCSGHSSKTILFQDEAFIGHSTCLARLLLSTHTKVVWSGNTSKAPRRLICLQSKP
jgi:hypothetical protein